MVAGPDTGDGAEKAEMPAVEEEAAPEADLELDKPVEPELSAA